MAQQLAIYKKGETDPTVVGDPTGVAITGLEAGTVVATGDYQVATQDSESKENTSSKVDVPGWTVLKATEPAPTNVQSTPTEDGANVSADTGK